MTTTRGAGAGPALGTVQDPSVLYEPGPEVTGGALVTEFISWLRSEREVALAGYGALRDWSVDDLAGFWVAIWDFFGVRASAPYARALGSRAMPGAEWFPGARLNYAEHCMGLPEDTDRLAVLAHSQTRAEQQLTYGDLREQVRRARAGLRRLGVGPGDRVVGYLPNVPETLVAFLATAALGAVWASCAPEFGTRSVLDRFGQLEPTVLIAVSGYAYGTKLIDRSGEVAALRAALPTVAHVVHVPYGPGAVPGATGWDELVADSDEDLAFAQVPFDTPLFVLFSSGTTGRPKAIVHGHGGILLEQLKCSGLSWDVRPGDRLQFFTTTAWMIWNTLVSALLLRGTMIMLDGDPMHPGPDLQWRVAARTRATHVGCSPGWLMACRRAGMQPAREHDLSAVRVVVASGSPLPEEGFSWVHEQFGDRVLLNVGSGGTDVCSGLVGGSPLLPVYRGAMSGPSLGVAAQAFDPGGQPVIGVLGELVVTEPMPSMPVGFWGDPDGRRYRAAYFDTYPGIWRHGDWVRFSPSGTAVITGRSDATLNRGGVRLGTAEFYRVVEELPDVLDSLVVHLEDGGGLGELILFLRLADGHQLDDALRARIATELRTALSPRHVPDRIEAVPAIPYTRTGKKLEVPVKRILLGARAADVATPDALMDPTALQAYAAFAVAHAATT